MIVTLNAAIPHWWHQVELLGLPYDWFTITHWEGLLHHRRYVDTETGKWRVEVTPKPEYAKQKWDVLILDESHKIKDRKTLAFKAVKSIARQSRVRILLTGTPTPNGRSEEMWGQLHILYPRQYTSYWRHFERYTHSVKHNKGSCLSCGEWHQREWREVLGNQNVEQLREELRPFAVRRMKKDCTCVISAPRNPAGYMQEVTEEGLREGHDGSLLIPHDHLDDLPNKQPPVIYYVDLAPAQRRAYEAMREDALAWVGQDEDQPLPAPVVIAQLTRLRQFASSYCEVNQAGGERCMHDRNQPAFMCSVCHLEPRASVVWMTEPSPKLDLLMELVQATESPAVVFTMFRQMVDLACKRFDKAGITYINLKPKPADQSEWVDFQNGRGKVFISTIQTGGEAIELFRASTVIFLDKSWSPKDNDQALGRLWRSGQKNAVQPIYIQAKDTVDAEVEERVVFKTSEIRRLLGG